MMMWEWAKSRLAAKRRLDAERWQAVWKSARQCAEAIPGPVNVMLNHPIRGYEPTAEQCASAVVDWDRLMRGEPTPPEIGSMFRYLYAKTEMLEEQSARLRNRIDALDTGKPLADKSA